MGKWSGFLEPRKTLSSNRKCKLCSRRIKKDILWQIIKVWKDLFIQILPPLIKSSKNQIKQILWFHQAQKWKPNPAPAKLQTGCLSSHLHLLRIFIYLKNSIKTKWSTKMIQLAMLVAKPLTSQLFKTQRKVPTILIKPLDIFKILR